jgi:hypothetical protein
MSLDCELLVEILPIWIGRFDQRELPSTLPLLKVLLALDRALNFVMCFVVDKKLHTVSLRESSSDAFSMLERSFVTPV